MSTVFFSHASAHMDAARDPVRRFPATGFDRAFDNPDLRPGPDVESDPDDWNRLIAFLSNGHKPEHEAVRIFGWNAIDALELAGPSVEGTKPGARNRGAHHAAAASTKVGACANLPDLSHGTGPVFRFQYEKGDFCNPLNRGRYG